MRGIALIIATLALAACDAPQSATLPAGVTAADVALFKAAVAENGCEVTNDAQAAPIEARTGFDSDKLRTITQYLTLAGESEPLTSGFRLTSGSCSNA